MKVDATDEVISKVCGCMQGVPQGLLNLGGMTREARLAACVEKGAGIPTLNFIVGKWSKVCESVGKQTLSSRKVRMGGGAGSGAAWKK